MYRLHKKTNGAEPCQAQIKNKQQNNDMPQKL